MSGATRGSGRRRTMFKSAPDGRQEHLDWLSLVEVSGPFLSLPVLVQQWPNLDSLDVEVRERLRDAHAQWQSDPKAGRDAWTAFVLRELLDWRGELRTDPGELLGLRIEVPEHDTRLDADFALVDPGTSLASAEAGDQGSDYVDLSGIRLLGLTFPPGTLPNARAGGTTRRSDQDGGDGDGESGDGRVWAATPVDRMAMLCRKHDVQLGLVTDGRWWTLVSAPRGGVTTYAVFDAITWPEAADRTMVRAFVSLLRRRRFFAVPEDEQLIALLKKSAEQGEDVTDQLGVQVRRAVELLVDAIGRSERQLRAEHDGKGFREAGVTAHDVYRGAVAVMMRIVFLLFAEDTKLLPSDTELYAESYSVARLCEQLEERVREANGLEEELEHSTSAWHRLLALFRAVHGGIDHPELHMHAYDGSIFDPDGYPWLEGRLSPDEQAASPLAIDDRTVYHMLLAVQYVVMGTGKAKERRKLTFRTLNVEQIGYVYEGLLSFEGFRAPDTVVGLIGKEGLEEEVELAELERLARPFRGTDGLDVGAFAAELATQYKDSKIGTPAALAKKLAPLGEADRKSAELKLHASTGDAQLVQRLLPFVGIIREDLRGLPVVIKAGSLYVTESKLRKNTGTHYTPRELAEQVAEGALEPLVYEPGPLQTADRSTWKLKPAKDILALKVADIAMGSAAFLVAACRYLATRLVEAWAAENGGSSPYSDTEARRKIVEHCLYGVDINPMAVEMAKLSLWIVSMDSTKPFTFLDDKLVAGDSLLGITSLDQLEYMTLRPNAAHAELYDQTKGIRALIKELIELRGTIADLDGDTIGHLVEKRRLLTEAREKTAQASLYADLVVGAALSTAGKGNKEKAERERNAQLLLTGDAEVIERNARAWLATDQPEGSFDREPVHWPLVFPEVFAGVDGGFDAVIGNPPFLGGPKVQPAVGWAYREYLVSTVAHDVRRTNTDFVAYFAIRMHQLATDRGQVGIIATNSLAQGDTREVSLDQVIDDGVEIRGAVKSERWPAKSAALEYCIVLSSCTPIDALADRVLDGRVVAGISTSLDTVARVGGRPHRLAANRTLANSGSDIWGTGFTMDPGDAQAIVRRDERHADVLFPYLNGKDLNQSVGGVASRWVINFHDWPEARAQSFPECYEQVERLVRPERGKASSAVRAAPWWQYWRRRGDLYSAIAGLDRVIVITLVSKVVMPMMVPTGQVFAHKLAVFASDDTAMLALLSSAEHYWWAISRSSTMKADLNYSPTDVFETLARPDLTTELRTLGDRLDTYRRSLMLDRQIGLTSTYNLVHDASCTAPDIAELRTIHRDIDYAVARAYGWDDLAAPGALDHGHHDTRQGPRYTVGPVVRQEILDRLLELNHARYAAEQAAAAADSEPETLF